MKSFSDEFKEVGLNSQIPRDIWSLVNIPGVSKKYGVADYQHFTIGITKQCDIFRDYEYNVCLFLCEVSIQFVKRDLDDKTANLNTNVFHPNPVWPIIPLAFITLFTFRICDWNFTSHTSRWMLYWSCLKTLHCYVAPFLKYC